ncbi:hypothetical protein AGMMS49965_12600 [Bacteroidia bacterium]|nr:hypothetical protein AGMMS49965_12600 [Bacteroidia bacterium]
MKRINKIYLLLAGLMLLVHTSCTDDFAELNTNPKSLPNAAPEQLLYIAETNVLRSGHAWNGWASKYRWMQYGVSNWGYGTTQYTYFSNGLGDEIYTEYQNIGGYVTNMAYLASLTEKPDAYKALNAAARIMLIAKGIQASDLWGSLVYSDGWQALNGKADEASLLPAFQSQEELSTLWDNELKAAIADLKTASGQVSLAGYDRAYNGDMTKWVKAGNAIRLRLASRLLKRKPAEAKAIATEVLAGTNAGDIMGSNDDSFIFWFDNLYTNIHGGDWHSSRDMLLASRALIDFMNDNEDPRRGIFFVPNNLSADNIADYNAQQTAAGKKEALDFIPVDFTRYEGSTASRADWTADARNINRTLGSGSSSINMRAANIPQARLWKGNDNDGSGGNLAPVMTYADFCFLAAEFVLEHSITSTKSAQEWYEAGVRTSLKHYNDIGKYCDVLEYSAMTPAEIDAYMLKSDVAWDNSKGKEQIWAQAWVDRYTNVDEAWAQWKRTGYPNNAAVLVGFEDCYPVAGEPVGVIPRRVKFSYPNEGVHNYANLKKRLDAMAADPEFGPIDNEWGRLWWDKQ